MKQNHGLKLGLMAFASAFGVGSAFAQSPPPAEPPAEDDGIVVTGSYIQGARINAALPVTVVDEAEIAAIGGVDGEDLIRSLPSQGAVAFRTDNNTTVNNVRGDIASINLRSIGSSGTLVLLNGRRVVNHPSTQAELSTPVTTTNMNSLPVAGIRRVEVLNDGASALYGTDAVAGVFNTILRDNFDGFSVSARQLEATGNGLTEQTYTMRAGRDFFGGKTNISFSGEYSKRDPLFSVENPLSASEDLRRFLVGTSFEGATSFDNRTTQTPWGEWTLNTTSTNRVRRNGVNLTSAAGVFHIQPSTLEGCLGGTAGALSAPGICIDDASQSREQFFDGASERTIISERERFNGFAFLNHDFANGVRLYGELGYYYAETKSTNEPRNGISATPISVPASYYWNPFGPTTLANGQPNPNRLSGLTNVPAAGLPVFSSAGRYRFVDVGFRDVVVENSQFRALLGARGEFGDSGWEWDSALLHTTARADDLENNSVSMTLFQQELFRQSPDVYNLFNGGSLSNFSVGDGTPATPAQIAPFLISVYRKSTTELTLADFKLNKNDLFALPGGGVGFAFGIEARREAYEEDRDPRLDGTIKFTDAVTRIVNETDVYGTSPTPDSRGSRDIYSAFAEFSIPLVSPEMKIPLVNTLDVQAAARVEDYSDFGSSGVKPRVAAAWKPADFFTVRGAWSKGFRAPNLLVVNEAIDRSNSRQDSYFCEAGVRNRTFVNFAACTGFTQGRTERRSVASDIGPENDTNLTYGFVFEPRGLSEKFAFLNPLTFTVDVWDIKREGVVGVFGAENQINLDYLLRLRGSSNPNVVRDTPNVDETAFFQAAGLTPTGDILFIRDTYDNNETIDVNGIDFGLYYDIDDTPIGDFSLKVNATKLRKFFIGLSPDSQLIAAAIRSGEISNQITVAQEGSIIRQDGQPEWQYGASLTWRHRNGLGAGLRVDFVDDYIDTSAGLGPSGNPFIVENWTETNLYLQYEFGRKGPLKDLRIRVGANNLFDKDPPLADEENGFDPSYHSIRGRQLYIDISKNF
jgi:outer membrane receptor protein involved in Fe transport